MFYGKWIPGILEAVALVWAGMAVMRPASPPGQGDPQALMSTAPDFTLPSLATTLVLNREGRIVKKYVGYQTRRLSKPQ